MARNWSVGEYSRSPVGCSGISFSVPRGSTTVMLGPNGAGKTSTVEHLEGYLPRAAGAVSVLGLDPARSARKLVGRVGLMLQGGAEEYVESAPWVAVFPGLAITVAVFGFNLFGDAVRDTLDPRLRSQ